MGKRIGFIGCGSITSAMLNGLFRSKAFDMASFTVYDVNRYKAKALQEAYGVVCATCVSELTEHADMIVVALHKKDMDEALKSMGDDLDQNTIVMSTAVGYPVERIREMCGQAQCVRIMPTISAHVGESMTAYTMQGDITEESGSLIAGFLGAIGKLKQMEEDKLDAYASIFSTSPAFFSIYLESMMDAARAVGFDKTPENYALAANVICGTAQMLIEEGMHPGAIKDRICTPASISIEGILELEREKMRSHLLEAYKSVYRRVEQI